MWLFDTDSGDYGTRYLNRALVTTVGLGANRGKDAVYPMSPKDAHGRAYDGANNCVMHFPKGELPQVNGFRSTTMNDPQFFFVANPIDRYSISPRQNWPKENDSSLLNATWESPRMQQVEEAAVYGRDQEEMCKLGMALPP